MVKQDVLIQNPTGLHARPAAQFINLCKNFPCSVKLEAEGKTCDAKSIFSVLKCAIRQGQTVSIVSPTPMQSTQYPAASNTPVIPYNSLIFFTRA